MRHRAVWAGDRCQGQGGLTGEVAVQADGDVVKSHNGPGSLSPPCDNLQPEPVCVLRGMCVRNSLGWSCLRIQHPAVCTSACLMTVILSAFPNFRALASREQSKSPMTSPAQDFPL